MHLARARPWLRRRPERNFAGCVEVGQVPNMGTVTLKLPAGETPAQSKRSIVRPIWLTESTPGAKESWRSPPKRQELRTGRKLLNPRRPLQEHLQRPPGPDV